MYVLTEIAQLETTGASCVDRLARSPDHDQQTCLVGRRFGDEWRCGGSSQGVAIGSGADIGEETVQMEVEDGGGDDSMMVRLPKNYQVTGPTVWKEPKLMSPFAARPLFLAMLKEGRDTLIPFFRNYLDPEIHLLTHYYSSLAWEGGQFCLWSARGREAVRREDCTVVKVEGKKVVKNPIRRRLPMTVVSTVELGKRAHSESDDETASRAMPEPGNRWEEKVIYICLDFLLGHSLFLQHCQHLIRGADLRHHIPDWHTSEARRRDRGHGDSSP